MLWWIVEPLIVVEAQEGEGDWICAVVWNGASAIEWKTELERPRYPVPKRSLDQYSSSRSGEESSDLRKQPQVQSVIEPGD